MAADLPIFLDNLPPACSIPRMPADASALLYLLRAAGFSLRTEGEQLLVSPASLLSPEQRQAIAEHKPALLTLLREEAAWERDTAALTSLLPDWGSSVQLVDRVLVRWPDGAPAAVLTLEEWEGIESWLRWIKVRRAQERGCLHLKASLWRRGPHVMERCSHCGANVRGPGKWVPASDVEDVEALPWLPGYAPEPDLFAREEP